MSVQDLGFDEFFAEDMSEEVELVVVELRSELGTYQAAKQRSEDAAKIMSEGKAKIQGLFDKLPDEYKTSTNQKPKTVAGQVFARIKKVITIDGFNLIFNEKVNTSSPRDQYLKELRNRASKSTDPAAKAAYLDAVSVFESHLKPKIGSEFKIEPVAKGKAK